MFRYVCHLCCRIDVLYTYLHVYIERIEQRDRIQSLIFEPKHVDIPAIETYLASLFSSTPEATAALDVLRSRLQNFGDTLLREQIDEDQMPSLIRSLLSRDLLSAEKATILKGFLSNEIVLKEVASVLGMQLARLDTWEWPEEGVFVEMRRHLSGKYRLVFSLSFLLSIHLIQSFITEHIWTTKSFKHFSSNISA